MMERPGLESKTEFLKLKSTRDMMRGQGLGTLVEFSLGGATAVNLLASILTFSVTISSLII